MLAAGLSVYALYWTVRIVPAKNPKDKCPKCRKSILTDDKHFGGVPASPETMLRCILYEMYVLASSALALKTNWQNDLSFQHGQCLPFNPRCSPLLIHVLRIT